MDHPVKIFETRKLILWHIDPLLCNRRITNTRFYATVEVLFGCNNGNGNRNGNCVFYVVRAEMI
jgi:hypothetical protein